jgi:transcriptional antiterminator RfaH
MTAYWCVCRSAPNREATAASFLGKAGYGVYLPRIRERRVMKGRRYVATPPLFPAYLFCRIDLQWHAARWCCGVAGIIMAADGPAKIDDRVIAELKGRERGGYVELDEPPRLRPGDKIKVTGGLLTGMTGLYSGMRGADRVAVLLGLVTTILPANDIEAV